MKYFTIAIFGLLFIGCDDNRYAEKIERLQYAVERLELNQEKLSSEIRVVSRDLSDIKYEADGAPANPPEKTKYNFNYCYLNKKIDNLIDRGVAKIEVGPLKFCGEQFKYEHFDKIKEDYEKVGWEVSLIDNEDKQKCIMVFRKPYNE